MAAGAQIVAATTWEIVFGLVAMASLAALWLVALFMIMVDDMSAGAKIVWLLLCIVLAPIAVPVYLLLRYRRHERGATATV